jgi:hypothetical protein
MASCCRQGRGQDDPQSKENDQPEIDHAFVVLADEVVRVRRKTPIFRKDTFHRAVALSRREFEKK